MTGVGGVQQAYGIVDIDNTGLRKTKMNEH